MGGGASKVTRSLSDNNKEQVEQKPTKDYDAPPKTQRENKIDGRERRSSFPGKSMARRPSLEIGKSVVTHEQMREAAFNEHFRNSKGKISRMGTASSLQSTDDSTRRDRSMVSFVQIGPSDRNSFSSEKVPAGRFGPPQRQWSGSSASGRSRRGSRPNAFSELENPDIKEVKVRLGRVDDDLQAFKKTYEALSKKLLELHSKESTVDDNQDIRNDIDFYKTQVGKLSDAMIALLEQRGFLEKSLVELVSFSTKESTQPITASAETEKRKQSLLLAESLENAIKTPSPPSPLKLLQRDPNLLYF